LHFTHIFDPHFLVFPRRLADSDFGDFALKDSGIRLVLAQSSCCDPGGFKSRRGRQHSLESAGELRLIDRIPLLVCEEIPRRDDDGVAFSFLFKPRDLETGVSMGSDTVS
jgi:hypothetical protein